MYQVLIKKKICQTELIEYFENLNGLTCTVGMNLKYRDGLFAVKKLDLLIENIYLS